ncbi:MoaD/ThiS family protein [Autumnicola musiva]|uniref:Molybdopterin synthase sulfur carrier subunit n=1 Tax=Autumnicola musiva TaxID=3075589 RepID=A0ABU3D565_9FLAO|nr:MoaD/ThiS family protein [Zunongwangia sp. F117]MDT0676679.1 MoaD/ThiS family protein [Zunongwangia sp. F117]
MISIKYFGAVAEATNKSSENLDLKSSSLDDVLKELHLKYDLREIPVKLALNQEIINSTEGVQLKSDDELAILPPFAGG